MMRHLFKSLRRRPGDDEIPPMHMSTSVQNSIEADANRRPSHHYHHHVVQLPEERPAQARDDGRDDGGSDRSILPRPLRGRRDEKAGYEMARFGDGGQ
jgi:hypothetical protein